MKRKQGSLWITVGLLLLAAALLLTVYNVWDAHRASRSVDRLTRQIAVVHTAAHTEVVLPAQETQSISPEAASPMIEETEIPDYILNPDMDMPTENIGGWDLIGVLEIPACDLTLPIIGEWSYPALKAAPARYAGSVYKDNLVIAGHDYKSHFGKIYTLQIGDAVIFTDMDDNVFCYTVSEIEILQPTDIEEMLSDVCDLTLFTCTYSGQSRLTVRCDRAEAH